MTPTPETAGKETLVERPPVCCYCDHDLSCAHCGKEQPSDDISSLRSQLDKAVEALEKTRAIVVDGAMVGFNYKEGNWAERLFANQGDITATLLQIKGEKR